MTTPTRTTSLSHLAGMKSPRVKVGAEKFSAADRAKLIARKRAAQAQPARNRWTSTTAWAAIVAAAQTLIDLLVVAPQSWAPWILSFGIVACLGHIVSERWAKPDIERGWRLPRRSRR